MPSTLKLSALFAFPFLVSVAAAESNSAFYFGLDNDGVFGVDQDYTIASSLAIRQT
jgi:hypothetical protein